MDQRHRAAACLAAVVWGETDRNLGALIQARSRRMDYRPDLGPNITLGDFQCGADALTILLSGLG
jgi:hypothetical protein